jgi:DNA polymerase (family 10)
MNKKYFLELLEELILFLELSEANPFKIRALSNAERILKSVPEELDELLSSGKIMEIKGIGKGITQLIEEVIQSGTFSELEKLRAEIPVSLVELRKIPGMGPKKIKTVWKLLNIVTIGELEYACRENRLRDLPGFGIKIQEKILNGIKFLQKYNHQFLLSTAEQQATDFLNKLKDISQTMSCEIAGSLRRKMEYVDQIDIIVENKNENLDLFKQKLKTAAVINELSYENGQKIILKLVSGITVNLWFATTQEFPFIFRELTGSREHNEVLKNYAKSQNFQLDANMLLDPNSNKMVCGSEEDIFRSLNLQPIPPELRENRGEILFAAQSIIPVLVEITDIKGVIHTHTNYSDGANTIEQMAITCKNKGYEYLVISDHSKSAFYANGLSEQKINQQHQEIDKLNQNLNGFRILKSIEADILSDGSLDYNDEVLARFDLVIASIHSKFNMTEEEATQRILKAMENPYVTILGHPTGRLLLSREGYPVDMKKIIDQAAETGIAIELNANPHRLDIDWRLLPYTKEKGVKISINPDAHQTEGIDDIKFGIYIARKGWLEPSNILNCSTAEELLEFAKKRQF